jgi:hypothetical protein
MAEPTNQTLRLLREFREEARQFHTRVDSKLAKLGADLSQVKDRLETLTRAIAGEIVQSRYVTAAVDERLANIERRLTALEEAR